jgi:hypothetical protein
MEQDFPGLNFNVYFNGQIKAKEVQCTEYHLSIIDGKILTDT